MMNIPRIGRMIPGKLMNSLFLFLSFQLLFAIALKAQGIEDEKVTVMLRDEPLLNGLHEIEAQSSFRFFYRKSEIKAVSGLNTQIEGQSVAYALNELLKNSGISFRQVDNHILLEKRNRQEGYLISGRVLGPDHKPAELATIKAIKVGDIRISSTALADTGGRFTIRLIENGAYRLQVSAHEADTLIHYINIGSLSTVLLPDLILSRNTIQLKGVDVVRRKPLISRSIDKLTLNIEGSSYEKGENALRLFSVIPGVVMNGRDIVFRGAEGVTVYVDNRRILLQGEQLLSYLRAIPSESIRSYELKTVPGSEIDAQNAGVVINIVLKSEYRYGLTGNVGTGYWNNREDNTKATTFLNYRTGKFNLQAGFNYFWSPAFYKDCITQQFSNSPVYSRQQENYLERYHNLSYNVAIDYQLGAKETLGINYNMFTNPGSVSSTYTTGIDYYANAAAGVKDSSSSARKSAVFTYANHMANVFYRKKLDTMGSRVDLGYSYIYYGLKDPAALETSYSDASGGMLRENDSLFTKTTGRSNVHVAALDLEKHFAAGALLNAGAKFTASSTDYTMDFRKGLNELAAIDLLRSNRFLYDEHILALYSSIAGSVQKWDYKIGLRAEQTSYTGNSVTSQQLSSRNQWGLFPSFFLNRKWTAGHSLTLSYNRRIERPGFRQLNPFITYTNQNTIQEGNPSLRPYYSNNLQLEYLLKNKYTFTVGFQNTNNAITETVTNRDEVVVYRDENNSDNDNVFLSLYIPLRLTKWWEFNTNATLRYRRLEVHNQDAIKRSKFTQNLWAANKFSLPGKYALEISGFYGSNDFYGIYDSYRKGKLDITVKKSFFKDRLSSSLEFQDPFRLYKPRNKIITPEFTRTITRERLDFVRYVGIFLTYNFSSGKKQNNKENVDAAGNQVRGRL